MALRFYSTPHSTPRQNPFQYNPDSQGHCSAMVATTPRQTCPKVVIAAGADAQGAPNHCFAVNEAYLSGLGKGYRAKGHESSRNEPGHLKKARENIMRDLERLKKLSDRESADEIERRAHLLAIQKLKLSHEMVGAQRKQSQLEWQIGTLQQQKLEWQKQLAAQQQRE